MPLDKKNSYFGLAKTLLEEVKDSHNSLQENVAVKTIISPCPSFDTPHRELAREVRFVCSSRC